MNRKILAIFAFMVVIVGMSAVSAFDLNSLFSDPGNNVTIGGIEFNIPDGYKEDTNLSVENELEDSNPYISFNISSKTFFKGENDTIEIGVSESDIKANDTFAKDASMGGNKTTVNGVDGYEFTDGDLYGFTFAKDGKLVIMMLSDEKLLSDIIVP